MTSKITDLENQPQQQHTSLIKDLDNLQTLSEEELQEVVGGLPTEQILQKLNPVPVFTID